MKALNAVIASLACHLFGASALAGQTLIQPLTSMGAGEPPIYWGFKLEAGRGAGNWTRIQVPSVWEQEGFGSYFYGMSGRGKPDDDPVIVRERGHYRTSFILDAAHRHSSIRLVFGGVLTDAAVVLNGKSAGPTHQGGFYQFEFDVSNLVRVGQNTLEVVVDKESKNPSVNRAERRGDYWAFAGIFRPVWLEISPRDHIDHVAVDARADGTLSAKIEVTAAKYPRKLQLRVEDLSGKHVASASARDLAPDTTEAHIQLKVSNPKLWTAESPELYRVTAELQRRTDGRWTSAHERSEKIGFRTFEVRPGKGLYLNGQRVIMKGVNRHSFNAATGRTTTREDSLQDVRLMKAANMNAVRMSHYPPDKHFLEVADELGLYVINELAGWQGAYDRETGANLIRELVRRDINHPSILFWANGNEGGWVPENDAEFAKWDLQRRPVLHPWAINSDINTDHYETYTSTVKLNSGPHIFMPTEFLHALYDGGGGAGLRDYWEVMRSGPHPAGGFIWAWMDEGIERTDENRRLDNRGSLAPDGIVGPHREREGSYFAIKQIWSPVQLEGFRIENNDVRMRIDNRFDFTNLAECAFAWELLRLADASNWRDAPQSLAAGRVAGPELSPGDAREWSFRIADEIPARATHLRLTAFDKQGQDLWSWMAPLQSQAVQSIEHQPSKVRRKAGRISVGKFDLAFDPVTGALSSLKFGGRVQPLLGPNALAYLREDKKFVNRASPTTLKSMQTFTRDPRGRVARINYDGTLREVVWRIEGDALIADYEIAAKGDFDLLGVQFGLKDEIHSKRWLGMGPYRVWRNRLEGGTLDVHEVAFNDPVPGVSYAYPEFKGYFSDWRWLGLRTRASTLVVENVGGIPYFGLFTPRGGEQPLLELPETGLTFLHVIPAMSSKFKAVSDHGPQSQAVAVSSPIRSSVRFTFPRDVE